MQRQPRTRQSKNIDITRQTSYFVGGIFKIARCRGATLAIMASNQQSKRVGAGRRKKSSWVPPVPFDPNDEPQLVPMPFVCATPFLALGLLIYQPLCTAATNVDGLLGVLCGLAGAIALVTLIAISAYYLPPVLVATLAFCSLWLSLPAAYWLIDQIATWEEKAASYESVDFTFQYSIVANVFLSILALIVTIGLMIGFTVTMRREV